VNTRITPTLVKRLAPYEIFVFGSNESGRHGAGAAKTAMQWGAVYGQAEGLQGRTYGIPTVNMKVNGKIGLDKIAKYIDRFDDFALENENLVFLVTEIGCGLAGYTVDEIAPLFETCVYTPNIYLPKSFWKVLGIET
jgi:hypothetical protein